MSNNWGEASDSSCRVAPRFVIIILGHLAHFLIANKVEDLKIPVFWAKAYSRPPSSKLAAMHEEHTCSKHGSCWEEWQVRASDSNNRKRPAIQKSGCQVASFSSVVSVIEKRYMYICTKWARLEGWVWTAILSARKASSQSNLPSGVRVYWYQN